MKIDLSKLPVPEAIQPLDYDTILKQMQAEFVLRWPDYSGEPHDPITKVLEVAALRELMLRQSHNEKASQIMLAFAKGSNLDALGALPWLQVSRMVITPADNTTTPPTPAVYENDDDYRQRLLLAYNQLSTAGSEGSYIYHAKSASPMVKDVRVKSPNPGHVQVTILSTLGDGQADSTLINTVLQALTAEKVRPLTDLVTVQSAQIVSFEINATIKTYKGASSDWVLSVANKQALAYVQQQHRIGLDITASGLYAALHVEGVQKVDLGGFVDMVISDEQAAFCTKITLTYGGVGE